MKIVPTISGTYDTNQKLYNYEKLTFLFIVSLLSVAVFSQNTGTIEIGKKKKKGKYIQNGHYLTASEMETVLTSCTFSAPEYIKYRKLDKTSKPLAATELIFLGSFGVVTILAGQEVNKNGFSDRYYLYQSIGIYTAIPGVVVGVVFCGFYLSSISYLKKSINNYNFQFTGYNPRKVTLYYGFLGNGVGIQIRF